MFRCDTCKSITKAGDPMTRRVAEYRDVTYPQRYSANRDGRDDTGGHGRECVREVRECPRCAAAVTVEAA